MNKIFSEICLLELQIKNKEDKLRHLGSVSVYKKKINLIELRDVITRFKETGQIALQDLLLLINETYDKINMETLLINLNVSFEIFGYDIENEEFM